MWLIGLTTLVITTLPGWWQQSLQTLGHQHCHQFAGTPGAYLDAVVNQIPERPLTNAVAANDKNLNALFAQPAGKQTQLVRRRFDDLCANNYTALTIRFDECEMLGFPKVTEEAAINNWNGNFQIHGFTVTGVSWLMKFILAARANNSSSSRQDNSPTNW